MAEYNSVNLGRIMPKYTGDYSTNVNYNTLDIVFYEGSSYIATQPSLRQTPAIDSEYWGLISGKGDTGPQGPRGATGPKGDKGDPGKDADMPVVGGRNYLLNSSGSNLTGWRNNTSLWSITSDDTRGNIFTITPSVAWTGGPTNSLSQVVSSELYQRQVTVSFWAKASVDGAKFHSEPSGGINNFNPKLTTSWARYSYTISSLSRTIYFMGVDPGTTYYLDDLQLEIGNLATDWSPAPEDADSTYVKKSNQLPAEARDFKYLASHMQSYQGTWWNRDEAIANAPIDNWTWSSVEVIPGNADSTGVIRTTRFATNATYSANVTGGVLGSWLPTTPSSRSATFTDFTVVAKSMGSYAGTWFATGLQDIKNGPAKMSFNSVITVISSRNDAGLIIVSSQGYNTWIGGVASGTIQHWTKIADDSTVVHNTGNETVAGNKMYVGDSTYMGTNTFMDGLSLNGKNVVNGVTDTDWLDIPLAEGRTGTAKYKVSLGKVFVHIDNVKGITAEGNNAQGQIGTLPVNPNPYYTRYVGQAGSTVRGITIAPNGVIYVWSSMGNTMSEDDSYILDTVLM